MLTKKIRHHPFWYAIACSLLLHVSTLNSLLLYYHFKGRSTPPIDRKNLQIQEVLFTPVEQLRTVGTKEGKKVFQEAVGAKDGLPANTGPASSRKLAQRQLEVSALAPQINPPRPPLLPSPMPPEIIPELAHTSSESYRRFQKEVQRELTIAPRVGDMFVNSDFNFAFEMPEGVSEDELNSTEKIFYSFQRRTFRSYVNSFVSAYHRMIQNRPYLLNQGSYFNSKEKMTGRVTFDREGNIISIKFLQWAENREIQELFENTLKGIKSLPNPPKALIQDNQEFAIYYQLYLNDQ